MLAKFVSTLPDSWLGKWLVFVSVLAIGNSIGNYANPYVLASRLYSRQVKHNVTPLAARLFATWTMTSAAIRLYCAYNLHNKVAYELGIISFIIALVHFLSEWLYYRSCALDGPTLSPLCVAGFSTFWMLSSYSSYISS